ncbi:MAG: caspase family protein, partial [bacterium]|nr:caspase family protein [bacterium]
MKKISCLIVLVLLLAVSQLNAHKGEDKITARRFAFIIGANNGGEGRVKLRYAIDDARSIANVLKNMGGVLSEDIRFLKDPDKKTLFSEMKKMKTGVNRAGSKYRRVEVIFYSSGHSDDKYLLL